LGEFREAVHVAGQRLGQEAMYVRFEEPRVDLIPVAVARPRPPPPQDGAPAVKALAGLVLAPRPNAVQELGVERLSALAQDELLARRPDVRLVREQYLRVLARPAEDPGLNGHVDFLQAGGSEAAVLAALMGSAEYRRLLGL